MKFDGHPNWFGQLNCHDPDKHAVASLIVILGEGGAGGPRRGASLYHVIS